MNVGDIIGKVTAFANPWVILGGLIALGSAWAAGDYHGHHASDATWSAKVATMEDDATKRVVEFKDKVIAAERRAADISDEVEKNHVESAAALDAAHIENARLVALVGLRDPGRKPARCPGVPPAADAPGSGPGGPASERLSDAATQFLLSESARADGAAEYGRACHEWAVRVGQ